jgi:hypothetical protein
MANLNALAMGFVVNNGWMRGIISLKTINNIRTMGEYQLKSNEPAYFIIVSHKALGWPLFSFASVLKDGK